MKLFGTDGLRGQAGEFPLDTLSVCRIGQSIGKHSIRSGGCVIVGGDTRESTPWLIAELAAAAQSEGATVAHAGTMTTPGIAELVLALRASAGISVSASHNPWRDNGIKIFGSDGRKWPGEWEEELEQVLLATREHPDPEPKRSSPPPTPPEVDRKLAEIYLQRLGQRAPAPLKGLPVLIDAGNGAAFKLGPDAFTRAGARVVSVNAEPNGRNINEGCGALHPESMAAATRERRAAFGVAYDGDADRSIFADEQGRILDGDDVLWIVATDWKRKGTLPPGGVVGTVMSNYGLEAALAREGIPFARAAVGDRNVARLMEERGAALGGETSGHVLLRDSPAGDGIATSLLLAEIIMERGQPLSQLATLSKVPQTLRNVRVGRRQPLEEISAIAQAVALAEKSLDHHGRVYLRYSGTEPLLRILVEGFDAALVERLADELETAARAELS
jgi:phosphoglucosamine mutase